MASRAGKAPTSSQDALGLVERTEEGAVSVPFDAVEIVVPLAQVA